MVILVIGPNSSGKSRFIETEERFRGFTVINVYDYQKKTEAEKGLSPYDQLYKANELLKSDVVGLVRQHKDVVVEQTFFRALRRLDLLEAIREASQEVPIEIYVMTPSDEQLRRNCLTRDDGDNTKATYAYERVKREMKEVFEFPNPAEGYSRIYAVSERGISERRDAPDWERIRRAKGELWEEAEKWARKQEAAARHEKLVQDMEHMRFWHYCEVCGRKELLTADEAYQQGWFESEQPSEEIKDYVERQLDKAGWRVDCVLTHTAPKRYEPTWAFLPSLDQSAVDKTTEEWLDSIERRLSYSSWYCGYYHVDSQEGPVRVMQEDFEELE